MNTNPTSSHNIKSEDFSSDEEYEKGLPHNPIPNKDGINQYRKTQKKYTENVRK